MKLHVRIWKLLLAFIPTRLPITEAQFDTFFTELAELYGLPASDDYRTAVASTMMHLSPTTAFKSKFYFALTMYKAMCNSAAYANIDRIRRVKNEKPADAEESTPA